jgi:hypothetical protein
MKTFKKFIYEQQTSFKDIFTNDIFIIDNTIKKHEKYIIDAVINFLKAEWDFDAKIIVKKKQNNKFIGDISLNNNSVFNNKFTLHFNPNQSYLGMINSLIHELTHIKQVSKGELRSTSDWKFLIWKDNYKISVRDYNKMMKDFTKYKEVPWEKEAYYNMLDVSLRDKLFKSKYWINLKGKDYNLDFIIDNMMALEKFKNKLEELEYIIT